MRRGSASEVARRQLRSTRHSPKVVTEEAIVTRVSQFRHPGYLLTGSKFRSTWMSLIDSSGAGRVSRRAAIGSLSDKVKSK